MVALVTVAAQQFVDRSSQLLGLEIVPLFSLYLDLMI